MGEETSIGTTARLRFKDDNGEEYHLFWGPGPWPGGKRWTNPSAQSAPFVSVQRNLDVGEIDPKSNWNVNTNEEIGEFNLRKGMHTAFLWLLSKPYTFDYCGAYDVSFSYIATEE